MQLLLLRETELRAILKNSEATLAVVRPELAGPLEALQREGAWSNVIALRGRVLATGLRALEER